MNLSNYNPGSRYKQRARHRVFSFVRWIVVVVIFVGGGFFFGKQYSSSALLASDRQLAVLEEERSELIAEVTDFRAMAQTADARYENIQQAYEEALPSGGVQELVGLMNKQLADGVSLERLEQAILNAQRPRQCSDPETRRFIVSTPHYEGSTPQISLDDDAIIVKASGTSVVNEEGEAEAWYDPTKQVKLDFELRDGEPDMKEAIMPFDHSIVLGDKEYRFSVSAGAKSFIKLTYDICDKL